MSSSGGSGGGGSDGSGSDYNPKYVEDLSNVPLSGADEYEKSEKLQALEHAEQSWLETDINQGETITNVTQAHRTAAAAIATFILATGIVHPNAVRGGDLADDGSRRSAYAEQFREIYRGRVSQILDKTPDADPGTGDGSGGNGGSGGDGTVDSTPFQFVTY